MMKVTLELHLNIEERKLLKDDVEILFHCCGQGKSMSETMETLRQKLTTVIETELNKESS